LKKFFSLIDTGSQLPSLIEEKVDLENKKITNLKSISSFNLSHSVEIKAAIAAPRENPIFLREEHSRQI
jgi:hypothetical protein